LKNASILTILCCITIVLGIIVSSAGLFTKGDGQPYEFETLRGELVSIYGKGLYRYDSSFKAPIFRGTDAVLLFLGIPFFIFSLIQANRGSLRGRLLLTGSLAIFLYASISMCFGAAYNPFFLLYILEFSASLFALIILINSFNLHSLSASINEKLPFKRIAFFLFFAALSPLVWLMSHVNVLLNGGIPDGLASYTTDITTALDIGVILPTVVLAGVLMLKRKPFGIVLSSLLLVLLIQIGLIVAGQTLMQILDGIKLTAGEIAAFVAPFITLSLISVWMVVSLLSNISENPSKA